MSKRKNAVKVPPGILVFKQAITQDLAEQMQRDWLLATQCEVPFIIDGPIAEGMQFIDLRESQA